MEKLKAFIKAHPKLIIFLTILWLIIMFNQKPHDGNSSSTSSSENAPDGLSRAQWERRCQQYSSARNECAVAANVTNCIEIKVGTTAAVMAQSYCSGETPNWSLMGMK